MRKMGKILSYQGGNDVTRDKRCVIFVIFVMFCCKIVFFRLFTRVTYFCVKIQVFFGVGR